MKSLWVLAIRQLLLLSLETILCTLLLLVSVNTGIAAESPKKKIQIKCGDYTWMIVCGRDDTPKADDPRECNHNKLIVITKNAKERLIADPPLSKVLHDDNPTVMLKGTTPIGMSCLSRYGKYYVSIEYSRRSGAVGLFYDWFESNGKRISSTGVLLSRETKEPDFGLSWKNLPKYTYIEGEE